MPKRPLAHKLAQTQGISLLEILLAIGIAVMAMTSLVVISNTAITSVDTARTRTAADQFVREGVELTRSYRDNNGWTALTAGLSSGQGKYYALDSTGTPQPQGTPTYSATANPCSFANTSTYQIPNVNRYYRVLTLYMNSQAEAKVTVTVCYNYKNGLWSSDSDQTLLTNWR